MHLYSAKRRLYNLPTALSPRERDDVRVLLHVLPVCPTKIKSGERNRESYDAGTHLKTNLNLKKSYVRHADNKHRFGTLLELKKGTVYAQLWPLACREASLMPMIR
jgi:hypothetical protein